MGKYYSRNFSGDILCDEALLRRYSKIKPIVTIDKKEYLLDDLSLEELKTNKNILFSDKKFKKAKYTTFDFSKYSCMSRDSAIALVKSFCPREVSVASILSQIPDELLDKVVAFKVSYRVEILGESEYMFKVNENGCSIVSIELYRKLIKLELLDDESLKPLNDRIIPIIEKDGKKYTCQKKHSLKQIREESYIWNSDDFTKKVDVSKFRILTHVKMLHGHGYYSLFKPSIAEILSQIPKAYIKDTVAFEIIDTYPMSGDEFDDGYHTSSVRLYGRK